MLGKPAEVNLERRRGDTWGPEFAIQQDGAAYDLTGASLLLTVNPRRAPADASNQAFQVAGVVTDAVSGVVRFPISVANAGTAPGVYFYDVQETNAAGETRTLIEGSWTVRQDITK